MINRPLLVVKKRKVVRDYFLLALCNSKIRINTRNLQLVISFCFVKTNFAEKPSSSLAKMTIVFFFLGIERTRAYLFKDID